MASEKSFARADDIRRVLNDQQIDAELSSAQLGYRLAGRHIALVIRRTGDRGDSDSVLRESPQTLGNMVGPARTIAARVDMNTTWCWVEWNAEASFRLPDSPGLFVAAQGRPANGIDRFRRSHHEATEALRVAELATGTRGRVIHYDDVDIEVLCSSAPELLRNFILDVLGPLAGNDIRTQNQRDTLAAFYEANSNYRATASTLGLHHKTVRYRLDQIEQLLGRSIEERRLSLELALRLAHTFGFSPLSTSPTA